MKLNQTVSLLDKEVKPRVAKEFAKIHQKNQKPELFSGLSRTYRRINDQDETFPPESKKVQANAKDSVIEVSRLLAEYYNLAAQRDWANLKAMADVVVDGTTVLSQAPTTFLLFLDKQLKQEIRPFVEALPVLSQDADWTSDSASGLFKTEPVETHKTKKVPIVLEKAKATDKHPAQVDVIHEDKVVGFWATVHYSGAMPAPEKKKLLERIDKLIGAVKIAIQEANSIAAPKIDFGSQVFNYLLSEK